MGGAPSLPEDLAQLSQGFLDSAVKISANDHGAKLLPVDWAFCGDIRHQQTQEVMVERLRRVTEAPVVSHQFAPGTVRLHNWLDWRAGGVLKPNSGFQAVLWAWLLGHNPIVMAGFGLYAKGQPVYWDDPTAQSSGSNRSVQEHLASFRSLYFQLLPCTIRAISGPIRVLTGLWDESRPVLPLYPSEKRRAYWAERFQWFEVIAAHDMARIGGVRLPEVGTRVWLSSKEYKFALKHNLVRVTSSEDSTPPPPYFNPLFDRMRGEHHV